MASEGGSKDSEAAAIGILQAPNMVVVVVVVGTGLALDWHRVEGKSLRRCESFYRELELESKV